MNDSGNEASLAFLVEQEAALAARSRRWPLNVPRVDAA
jgi:hypothetical protein